jgi:hypothetical protein
MESLSNEGMGRREFIGKAASALFSGMAVQILGCDALNNNPAGEISGQISDNHGHIAVITKVQLDGGWAITLNIQGSADHDHTVDLIRQDMADIKSGMRASRYSSTNSGHNHLVTFN